MKVLLRKDGTYKVLGSENDVVDIEQVVTVPTIKDREWLEVNAKFWKLISIFSDPAGSLPENMEYAIFHECSELHYDRMERAKKSILFYAGCTEPVFKKIDGELTRVEHPLSLSGVSTKEYQQIYPKCRDFIFSYLLRFGWTSKNLDTVYGCLFAGIPLNEYNQSK